MIKVAKASTMLFKGNNDMKQSSMAYINMIDHLQYSHLLYVSKHIYCMFLNILSRQLYFDTINMPVQ